MNTNIRDIVQDGGAPWCANMRMRAKDNITSFHRMEELQKRKKKNRCLHHLKQILYFVLMRGKRRTTFDNHIFDVEEFIIYCFISFYLVFLFFSFSFFLYLPGCVLSMYLFNIIFAFLSRSICYNYIVMHFFTTYFFNFLFSIFQRKSLTFFTARLKCLFIY